MRKSLTEKRVIRRFLFIPKIINREWRWMEFAKIEQELIFQHPDDWIWINIRWL